jgi:hypothetical protein
MTVRVVSKEGLEKLRAITITNANSCEARKNTKNCEYCVKYYPDAELCLQLESPFEVDPAELNPKISLATINIHNCIVTANQIAFSMQMYSD